MAIPNPTAKAGAAVAGLVLFLDGIGLAAFSLTADLLGFGHGYGLGGKQVWGLVAGVCLTLTGLSLLRLAARGRETGPGEAGTPEGEPPREIGPPSPPEKG